LNKKAILLSLLWLLPAGSVHSSASWPSPSGALNDFAHVVPSDQAQALESYLEDFQDRTGDSIVVVTVPSVEGGDIDGAAVDLFKAWGIGQKGKDTGVLLMASIQDRRARIEVGYGLEGVLTDGQAGSILRHDLYPYFRQKDYGRGLGAAVQAIAQIIAPGAQGTAGNQPQNTQGGSPSWLNLLFIALFILFSVLNLFFRRGFWGGYWGGGWGGGGWGGGWGGGGGGGFGGFGGGGSGGGGASGGW
jgi:uncharacterized protein